MLDGWVIHARATHGVSLKKQIVGRTLVTVIPTSSAPLPGGTLQAILGPKQTRLGRSGLLDLLNRFGLK